MQSIFLFGISTTSSRIKSFIEYHQLFKIEAFVVDDLYKSVDTFENYPVLTYSDFKKVDDFRSKPIFICMAWNRLNEDRKNTFVRLKSEDLNIINIISPTAIVRGEVEGRNIFIGDQVCMEAGSVVYDNVFMDHNCFVGTNTVIKRNSYICAKSMIAGSAVIGEQTFVGIHSTVFDQVVVGEKCIISGGEVIKRNILDYSLVKEKDGRQVTIQYDSSSIIKKLMHSKNVR